MGTKLLFSPGWKLVTSNLANRWEGTRLSPVKNIEKRWLKCVLWCWRIELSLIFLNAKFWEILEWFKSSGSNDSHFMPWYLGKWDQLQVWVEGISPPQVLPKSLQMDMLTLHRCDGSQIPRLLSQYSYCPVGDLWDIPIFTPKSTEKSWDLPKLCRSRNGLTEHAVHVTSRLVDTYNDVELPVKVEVEQYNPR